MIEIPIAGLLTVLGVFTFMAAGMWIVWVNGELKDRGDLADHNTAKIGNELRDIKKRLHALETKKDKK